MPCHYHVLADGCTQTHSGLLLYAKRVWSGSGGVELWWVCAPVGVGLYHAGTTFLQPAVSLVRCSAMPIALDASSRCALQPVTPRPEAQWQA